jgi:hypothetical protein
MLSPSLIRLSKTSKADKVDIEITNLLLDDCTVDMDTRALIRAC